MAKDKNRHNQGNQPTPAKPAAETTTYTAGVDLPGVGNDANRDGEIDQIELHDGRHFNFGETVELTPEEYEKAVAYQAEMEALEAETADESIVEDAEPASTPAEEPAKVEEEVAPVPAYEPPTETRSEPPAPEPVYQPVVEEVPTPASVGSHPDVTVIVAPAQPAEPEIPTDPHAIFKSLIAHQLEDYVTAMSPGVEHTQASLETQQVAFHGTLMRILSAQDEVDFENGFNLLTDCVRKNYHLVFSDERCYRGVLRIDRAKMSDNDLDVFIEVIDLFKRLVDDERRKELGVTYNFSSLQRCITDPFVYSRLLSKVRSIIA